MAFYMTVDGYFAASYDESLPAPLGVVLIPPERLGLGEGYGTRWDGAAWVDAPEAYDRALAAMRPEQALAQERAGMVADKWQVVAALEILHPGSWVGVMAYRTATDEAGQAICDPVTAAAIDFAVTLPRLSETIDLLAYLLGLDGVQVDAVFRLAMSIRG